MAERCCSDVAMHCHPESADPHQLYWKGRPYHYRHRFEFRWPTVRVYRPADRRTRVMLNRYPGVVIGAAVVLGGRCFSLLWGRPGDIYEVDPS